MEKIVAYLLVAVGLIGLALNSRVGRGFVPFLEKVPSNYLLIGSLVLFVIGIIVLIVMGKGNKKIKQYKYNISINTRRSHIVSRANYFYTENGN